MIDNSEIARGFAYNAELYVSWFDKVVSDEASPLSIRKLHEALALVQAAAARLPPVAPGEEANSAFERHRDVVGIVRSKLPVDAYSVVFDRSNTTRSK